MSTSLCWANYWEVIFVVVDLAQALIRGARKLGLAPGVAIASTIF